jgi:ribosomal subunit interface protein
MASSDAVEAYVRARASKLERFSDRITGCHVVVEIPHRHKLHGQHQCVRIDLIVPGGEIVITRDPSQRKVTEDLYASIDAAFDDAKRLLEDHVRTLRHDVKSHEEHARHGRVKKLFAYEGYGFLESPEGDEVYFHRNSVLHGGFNRLELGSRVRFVQEDGEKGPQASTVVLLG